MQQSRNFLKKFIEYFYQDINYYTHIKTFCTKIDVVWNTIRIVEMVQEHTTLKKKE